MAVAKDGFDKAKAMLAEAFDECRSLLARAQDDAHNSMYLPPL